MRHGFNIMRAVMVRINTSITASIYMKCDWSPLWTRVSLEALQVAGARSRKKEPFVLYIYKREVPTSGEGN